MKDNFRRRDLLARIGGDEFAFFLVDADTQSIEKVANNILDVVQHVVFECNGEPHYIGASIGVVTVDGGGSTDYKTHYQHADKACYKAKENGKNCVEIRSDDIPATDEKELAVIVASTTN